MILLLGPKIDQISIRISVPCLSSLWDSLFGGPRRGLYQICPLWGVPELRENHLGASWSTKTAKKLWSQQHMMTCLASLRHQTSKKLAPSSFTLLLGPPPAPFLIPKWCQISAREANTAEITLWFTLSSIASNKPLVYLPHGIR